MYFDRKGAPAAIYIVRCYPPHPYIDRSFSHGFQSTYNKFLWNTCLVDDMASSTHWPGATWLACVRHQLLSPSIFILRFSVCTPTCAGMEVLDWGTLATVVGMGVWQHIDTPVCIAKVNWCSEKGLGLPLLVWGHLQYLSGKDQTFMKTCFI